MRTGNKKLDLFFLVVIVLIVVGLPFGISYYDEYISSTKIPPDARQFTLIYSSDPDSVMRISAGRRNNLLVDPTGGEILHEGQTSIAEFFSAVTEFHRWFAMSAES